MTSQKFSAAHVQALIAALVALATGVSWAVSGRFAAKDSVDGLTATVAVHEERLQQHDREMMDRKAVEARMAQQIDEIHKYLIEGKGR